MKELSKYPVESWRPNQRAYADRVLELATSAEATRAGLEGPCGCGKSIGYLRPLLAPGCPKSVVLTTTRQHLRQLEETLRQYWPEAEEKEGGWAILRGRSFYTCCGARKPGEQSKNPITAKDYDPGKEWSGELQDDQAVGVSPRGNQGGSDKCPLGDSGCLYRRAVRSAAQAQVVLQCTIGGLYRRRYWGELEVGPNLGGDPEKARERAEWILARRSVVDRDVVVLDEAHEYLRVRRDYETTKLELWTKGVMDPRRVQQLQLARQKGNYVAGYVLLEPETALRYMVEAELKRLLEPANVERMLPAGKHLDNRDEIKRRWIEKLETRLALFGEESDNRVLSVQWEGWGEYEKAYLVSEPLFAGVGEPLAKREIFTSATLASIAPLLKIPPKNVTIYPEIFDWDSHVSVAPLPDNARGSVRNEPLTAADLADIYSAPGRPLTVVLFLSKTQTMNATKLIAKKPGVYIQGADKDTDLGELVEQVKRRASETYDALLDGEASDVAPMLITYGGWVGTDIPGDKWLVLGSAPKTPITPVFEARQARGKTRSAWNDFEKRSLDKLQLQQGLGRALRTPDDNAQIIWPNNNAFSELGMSPETGRIVEDP